MFRPIGFVLVITLAGTVAFSQLSPEEAQAKLKEKAEQRNAERAKMVQISEGQLEDMQAELTRLRLVVADLQKKLNPQAVQAAAKPHKTYNNLEIGMSKEDVLEFVRRHSGTYKVTAVSAAQQGGVSAVETTHIRREGRQQVAVSSADPFGAQAPQSPPAPGQESVVADTTVVHQAERKTEHMTLTSYRPEQYESGSHVNVLGKLQRDYDTRMVPSGRIEITLVDDVVTAIDARG